VTGKTKKTLFPPKLSLPYF